MARNGGEQLRSEGLWDGIALYLMVMERDIYGLRAVVANGGKESEQTRRRLRRYAGTAAPPRSIIINAAGRRTNYFAVLLKCPSMMLTLNITSLLFTSTVVAPGCTARRGADARKW